MNAKHERASRFQQGARQEYIVFEDSRPCWPVQGTAETIVPREMSSGKESTNEDEEYIVFVIGMQ